MPSFDSVEATARLAEWVDGLKLADLPASVRREARRSFLNFLGCAVGGSSHSAVTQIENALAQFSGLPEATLVGRRRKADLLLATLINCYSSSVLTFDDTHAEAIVHPTGPVAAAILALAERRKVSGAEFLAALALGVEIVCRLSKTISVSPAQGTIAWNQTGVTGGIGAAAAAGKLLGLDAEGIASAMGIAASQSAGLRIVHGSACMPMMPANAAQTGLRAAILAKSGLSVASNALEGKYGHAETFSAKSHLPWLTDRLGEHFEILQNTYKPFPCGIVIHPAIEAALQARKELKSRVRSLRAITVRVNPTALQLTDRRHPLDSMEAQVSLYHWIAVSLIHGSARLVDGSEQSIREPTVVALRDRIEAVSDPSVSADSTRFSAVLEDGSNMAVVVDHCIGSVIRPMSDDELEAKFSDLSQGILPVDRIAELLDACRRIEELPDAGLLARLAG